MSDANFPLIIAWKVQATSGFLSFEEFCFVIENMKQKSNNNNKLLSF